MDPDEDPQARVLRRAGERSAFVSAAAAFPTSRVPVVNVATVPQRSPLRYPGGKTWLIPHIREWLQHTRSEILIEPFAGGAIVSLTAVMEDLVDGCVMVEIDRDVAAFWRSVLESGANPARVDMPIRAHDKETARA